MNKLEQKQSLPLRAKVMMTERRIREFYNELNGKVYVSFSGGKDSTVLLHIARRLYPNIPAVFLDTGLEYPEIREFVKTIDNVIWLKPKMSFREVLSKYGYPVISKEIAQKIHEIKTTKSDKLRDKRLHGDEKGNGKLPTKWHYLKDLDFKISHNCCNVMKKRPAKKFEKETGLKPIVGTMAYESSLRRSNWERHGCNSFETKRPISAPLSFWLEDDIWNYLNEYKIPYSKIYDMGYTRTGCMFCMFGVHLEKESRFEKMKKTHPKIYDYCMDQLGCREVLNKLNIQKF